MNRLNHRIHNPMSKLFNHTKNVEKIQKISIIISLSQFVGSERRK